MHTSAHQNCKKFVSKYLNKTKKTKILDVGSFDVNGTLKPLFQFPNWEYIGMDKEGESINNVDVILENDHSFPFEPDAFDITVSSSCLEHDPMFWITFQEMVRVTKSDGLIYLNVPSQGPYHGFPVDCWRFLKDSYLGLAKCNDTILLEQYIDSTNPWQDNVGIFRVKKQEKYIHQKTIHNENAPEEIIPKIMEWFNPSSVIDVGCGLGHWLATFKKSGVKEILGIEGNHLNTEEIAIPLNNILFANLEDKISLKKKFDIAICLEVVEHLSPQSADTIVESLTNLSDVILFSAAIPNQGGQNHINEQWIEYWEEKFTKKGFTMYDELRPIFWKNKNIFYWYRQNMVLIIKNSVQHQFKKTNPVLNLVHPELFSQKINEIELLKREVRNLKFNQLGIYKNIKRKINAKLKKVVNKIVPKK